MSRKRMRSAVFGVGMSLALGAGVLFGLGPTQGVASSHREAPLTAADPQIDNTDVYAFVSPDRPNTVTLVSSWIPFEEPAGGPNFYLWAEDTNYNIHISNDGGNTPDITYQWRFKTHFRNPKTFLYNTGPVTSLRDKDLNIFQTYDLWRIKNGHRKRLLDNAPVAPSNVGAASMPNYNGNLFDSATTRFGKYKNPSFSWVGQSDDPFFLDLRVFDLLYGGNLSEVGDDTLAGFNVNTFALQVPIGKVTNGKQPVIGVWSTATRKSTRIEHGNGSQGHRGKIVQVSRLGNPLVNEVVVPVGLKDYFNSSKPTADGAALPLVQNPELPHLLHAVYGTQVPDSNPNKKGIQRSDLISVFLTGVKGLNQPKHVKASEMLRLNTAIPPCTSGCSRLGVLGGDLAGFPNGRRLADDVIDESLRVVLGVLLSPHQALANTIGDGVNVNDKGFLSSFPFVAYPHAGSNASPH